MTELVPQEFGGLLDKSVTDYVKNALSDNTLKAYKADLSHFSDWGGVIPCTPDCLACYLSDHAELLSVATLQRRMSSISKAHQAVGYQSPVPSQLVQMTFRGIQRRHGKPQDCAAPLLKEDIVALYGQIQHDTKGIRDCALILTGFCGAFRRSELVGLNIQDVEFVSQGAIIMLCRSKTDQIGKGRKIGIPFGRGRICPVKSLQEWLDNLSADNGPIFRPVDKGGNTGGQRLSTNAVSCIIKEYVGKIGLDPNRYSGHSLRSGLATSAAMQGVPSWKIRQQTGHASDAMLARYIRDSDLFSENAAGHLF